MKKNEVFNNIYCKICGKRFWPGIHCHRVGGVVCDKHCKGCKYFTADWHCMYNREPVSGGTPARHARAVLIEKWKERGEDV